MKRRRPPYWLTNPRRYPYRNDDDSPRCPLKVEPGLVVNKVRVKVVPRVRSTFYDQTQPAGRANRFEHMTGDLECECLVCGREFTAGSRRINPNHPERSMWSCGCQRRPVGMGFRSKGIRGTGKGKGGLYDEGYSLDLRGTEYGMLEPMSYFGDGRWLCFCHNCKNPDGCFVLYAEIYNGWVTACPRCRPDQWRGRLKTDRRAELIQAEMAAPDPLPPSVPWLTLPVNAPPEKKSRFAPLEPDPDPLPIVQMDREQALARFKVWQERAKVRGQKLTEE